MHIFWYIMYKIFSFCKLGIIFILYSRIKFNKASTSIANYSHQLFFQHQSYFSFSIFFYFFFCCFCFRVKKTLSKLIIDGLRWYNFKKYICWHKIGFIPMNIGWNIVYWICNTSIWYALSLIIHFIINFLYK